MAVAFVQGFDRRRRHQHMNYVAIAHPGAQPRRAPDRLIAHTAGFDHDQGVFGIFDVLGDARRRSAVHRRAARVPIIERFAADAGEGVRAAGSQVLVQLHDVMSWSQRLQRKKPSIAARVTKSATRITQNASCVLSPG